MSLRDFLTSFPIDGRSRTASARGSGRGAARRREADGIVLRLVGGSVVFSAGDDLGRIFRHRYVLMHYLGLSVPIVLVFLIFNPTGALFTPYLPSTGLGIASMMATVSAYVWVLRRLLRRLSLPSWVPLTPGFVLGATVMVIAVQSTGYQMGMLAEWSRDRSVILVLIFTLYLELVAGLVLRGPVPRAVAKLAAERKAATAAQMLPVSLGVEKAAPDLPPGDGDEAAALGDLLRLEAQGNYVLVVTAGGRHVLPGPFAARLARLQDQPGEQVHRSHWVAQRAVVAVHRSGRRTVIETVDGAEIQVAGARAAEIRVWAEAAARGQHPQGPKPVPRGRGEAARATRTPARGRGRRT